MPLALAAVTAAWALGALALGVADALAYLAPALLLLLPLLAGRYPGDTALVRAAIRRRPGPRRVRRAPPRRRRPLTRLLPRGGRLLPAGLAGRAPPASAVLE